MTENSDNTSPLVIDTKRRNRNRVFLVALVILGMMPLFAAIVVYYGAGDRISGAQTNSGALLSLPGDFMDLSKGWRYARICRRSSPMAPRAGDGRRL